MDVRVVDHPLARARLSTMRDARTDNATFRAALRDLTLMLIYEATRDAPVATAPLHTPVARTTGYRLATPPLLVPVLRAGLGMVDAAQALMPEAQMGFVGLGQPTKMQTATDDLPLAAELKWPGQGAEADLGGLLGRGGGSERAALDVQLVAAQRAQGGERGGQPVRLQHQAAVQLGAA